MTHLLLSILALVAPFAAMEQPAQSATSATQNDANKKVCRMIAPTGSIMAKRFCLTKQEWKDMNRQTSDSASSALSRRGTGMCDINCPGGPGG